MKTRIYIVEIKGAIDEPRMVQASSQAAAINHIVRRKFKAHVGNALEVHELTEAGTKLETAGEALQDDAGPE